MDSKLLENPTIVKMILSVITETLKEKVNEDTTYLNTCSIDEFVRVSEIIKDDESYSFEVLKDILYNLVKREDLQPVFNMVLCNVCYYLDKFDNVDYKYQDIMKDFLLPKLKNKEEKHINKYLLKYFLVLVKKNIIQFQPDSKNELVGLFL